MIEQVELRPVQPSDAEMLARLFTEQREFLAPFDPDRPEGFFTVAGQRSDLEQSVIQRQADLRHRFLIVLDGQAVGVLSVSNLVRGPFQSANLGYWVAQQVNGRGVATRAVGEACRWAERSLRGMLKQEPPRATWLRQSPDTHAEPSVGAPPSSS